MPRFPFEEKRGKNTGNADCKLLFLRRLCEMARLLYEM